MPSKAFGSASLLPQCCFVPDKALKIAFWRWDSLPMWISTPSEPALPRRRKPQSTRLSKKRIEITKSGTAQPDSLAKYVAIPANPCRLDYLFISTTTWRLSTGLDALSVTTTKARLGNPCHRFWIPTKIFHVGHGKG